MSDSAAPPAILPYYPPAGFYFQVSIPPYNGANEGSFQEVSGLSVTMTPLEVKEGGNNSYALRLPQRPKYSNVVLKRGLLVGSGLTNWVQQTLLYFTFTPTFVVIDLKSSDNSIVTTWTLYNAYPVAMKVSELKAQENSIVIETLELTYDYFETS